MLDAATRSLATSSPSRLGLLCENLTQGTLQVEIAKVQSALFRRPRQDALRR